MYICNSYKVYLWFNLGKDLSYGKVALNKINILLPKSGILLKDSKTFNIVWSKIKWNVSPVSTQNNANFTAFGLWDTESVLSLSTEYDKQKLIGIKFWKKKIKSILSLITS